MPWLLLWLLCTPAASAVTSSDDTFYRAITSGFCANVTCTSFAKGECNEAFNLMNSQSGVPRPEEWSESSSYSRPVGCLPDFDVDSPSMQFNEVSIQLPPEATEDHPLYCLCPESISEQDFDLEFKQEREEFESAVEWCDGWMGDIEVDPEQAWIESGGTGGTPSVLYRSLESELNSRAVGFVFQPGAGFAETYVKSIGIRFLELAEGVELLGSLRGGSSCDHSSGELVCEDDGEPEILFSESALTPGKGTEETVYFLDLFDLRLNVSWTYFLEFAFPELFASSQIGSARLPVWRPIPDEPWAYEFGGTIYFEKVQPWYLNLVSEEYITALSFPQMLFKLCVPAVKEDDESTRCSSAQSFFSFKCDVWIYALVVVLLALCVLGLCCSCCTNRQEQSVVRFQDPAQFQPDERRAMLNFVDFETGETWYRRDIPLSHPIKLLCIDVAVMLGKPASSTSLWLAPGQRLRWCYTVGDYKLSYTDTIYVVRRPCNSICGCFSIEDLICCILAPDFSAIAGQPTDGRTQMTRLIPAGSGETRVPMVSRNGETWLGHQPTPASQMVQRF